MLGINNVSDLFCYVLCQALTKHHKSGRLQFHMLFLQLAGLHTEVSKGTSLMSSLFL